MLPSINGKSFMDCSLEDLTEILDNESYRESDQVDYKKTFAVFDIPKENKEAINKEKAEFRKDVCAMANAQGGYLVYGIKEDGKGIPHEIDGVAISDNNTDKFENGIRNVLQTVSPKPPHCELRFIPYEDKYIIVIYVHHDFYAPYVFLENNQDYRIYKRAGNAAIVVSYPELKTMFTQTLSLEHEILQFRNSRVAFYQGINDCERFALFHIIPDTFLDSSYNQPVFAYEKQGRVLSGVFSSCLSGYHCQPTVEGFRCNNRYNDTECRLYNNGIAECFIPLLIDCYIDSGTQRPSGEDYFREYSVWEAIEGVLKNYYLLVKPLFPLQRAFTCFSVIGCKGVVTETDDFHRTTGSIDRNKLISMPVVFEYADDESALELNAKRFRLEYLLSLGIKSSEKIGSLIKEVYSI